LKKNYILALEMASPGNQHCANWIGTLSFPIVVPPPPIPQAAEALCYRSVRPSVRGACSAKTFPDRFVVDL